MKKIGYSCQVVIIFLLALLFQISLVQATTADFGLKANYNDHQTSENGMIDVYGEPNSTQNISIAILNKDNKTHKYNVYVNTAYTSGDGKYMYSRNLAKDPTLKIKISQYVQPRKQTVTVNGTELKNVTFKLTVPAQKYQGYLMGGIIVKPAKGEKSDTSVTGNGTVLKNKYEQGIPLRVTQAKATVKLPNFRVRYVEPFANNTMKTRGVRANLQNYVKGFNNNINAKATVTRRPNDHKFKKVNTAEQLSPAPNSNYDYQIDWGKTPLQAGDYHLHMKLTTSDKTKSWIVDKNFSISNEDAAKYNKLSGIKPNYMWLWILIAILVLLLVLGLGVYFGRRNQQKNQPPMNNYNQR